MTSVSNLTTQQQLNRETNRILPESATLLQHVVRVTESAMQQELADVLNGRESLQALLREFVQAAQAGIQLAAVPVDASQYPHTDAQELLQHHPHLRPVAFEESPAYPAYADARDKLFNKGWFSPDVLEQVGPYIRTLSDIAFNPYDALQTLAASANPVITSYQPELRTNQQIIDLAAFEMQQIAEKLQGRAG